MTSTSTAPSNDDGMNDYSPRTRTRLHSTRPKTSARLLDLKEAERYSGISAWTLRDLIASGELPAVRPPRLRRVWIDRLDLDEAIAKWKGQAEV